jgi:hypothetical protein
MFKCLHFVSYIFLGTSGMLIVEVRRIQIQHTSRHRVMIVGKLKKVWVCKCHSAQSKFFLEKIRESITPLLNTRDTHTFAHYSFHL